jgi:hypothetical protein
MTRRVNYGFITPRFSELHPARPVSLTPRFSEVDPDACDPFNGFNRFRSVRVSPKIVPHLNAMRKRDLALNRNLNLNPTLDRADFEPGPSGSGEIVHNYFDAS